jgi:LPS O-antigen subunit length determinant protein (WzzB/FepE family)
MKRTIITLTVLFAALGFAILFGAPKVQTFNASAAIAAPAPAPLAVPVPARCPRIHEAIRALEVAERDMREAGHDFCGHKREAMEATHRAIEQLRAAEGCDSCR